VTVAIYSQAQPAVSAQATTDSFYLSRPGLVDWVIAFYLLALGALQATPYWYASTYVAFLIPPAFFLMFQADRCTSIPEFWLAVGLLGWMALTSMISPHSSESVQATWFIGKIFMVGLFVMARCNSLPTMKLYIKALLIGVATVAAAGAVMGYGSVSRGGDRVAGVASQVNALGGQLLAGIVAGMLLLPFVGKTWRMVIIGFFLASFISLLASGSRGAAVAVGAAVMTYFALEYIRNILHNWKLILPAAIVLIALPIIAVEVFPDSPLVARMTGLVESKGLGGGQMSRWHIYVHAWGLFCEHPILGTGMGTYRHYSEFVYTHTSFLELLTGAGLFAFVLYYAIIVVAWMRLTRLVKLLRHHPASRKCLNAGRAALVGLVIHGAFAVTIQGKASVVLICMLAGFSARLLWAIRQDLHAYDTDFGSWMG